MKNEIIKDVQLVLMDGQEVKIIKTYGEVTIENIDFGNMINLKYKAARPITVNRFILKKGVDIIRAARLPYPVNMMVNDDLEITMTTTVKHG